MPSTGRVSRLRVTGPGGGGGGGGCHDRTASAPAPARAAPPPVSSTARRETPRRCGGSFEVVVAEDAEVEHLADRRPLLHPLMVAVHARSGQPGREAVGCGRAAPVAVSSRVDLRSSPVPVLIRPFRRADRDQVTALVNAHAAAVVPGVAASVNSVLGQFEREPDEVIVDPWVLERRALVGRAGRRVAAAALVVRYRDEADVGPGYRGLGEIRWLVFRPEAPAGNPYWRDGWEAARLLLTACLEVTAALGGPAGGLRTARCPCPVCTASRRSGRTSSASTPRPASPSPTGSRSSTSRIRTGCPRRGPRRCRARRAAPRRDGRRPPQRRAGRAESGSSRWRCWTARNDIRAGRRSRRRRQPPRRRRLPTAGRRPCGSLAQAAAWLRLAHVDRLLAYATPEETALIGFLEKHGFVELTRTRRGWERTP